MKKVCGLILIAFLFICYDGIAQNSKQKIKVDPDFEKFWTEFKDALGKNDKTWFENNTAFPIITLAECESIGGLVNKTEYFSNWIPVDKKTLNKIKKIKSSTAQLSKKQENTYDGVDGIGKGSVKHLPNGTPLVYMGYQDGDCYQSYYFAKINNKFKFIGHGSCCASPGD
jgi:hypothetical protein